MPESDDRQRVRVKGGPIAAMRLKTFLEAENPIYKVEYIETFASRGVDWLKLAQTTQVIVSDGIETASLALLVKSLLNRGQLPKEVDEVIFVASDGKTELFRVHKDQDA